MPGIGAEFYQATKYHPETPPDYRPIELEPVETVTLPPPPSLSSPPLAELLAARRSRRRFAGEAITLEQLSFLLWAADGVSASGLPPKLRTAPSAGACHPITTYLVVNRVDGLAKGVYRYGVEGHFLERIRRGDFENAAVKGAAGQDWLKGSCIIFIWIAEFAKTTVRYKERGYRYVFMDAGHICQNVYLAAESLSLGVTGIAALVDDEVNAIVGADGKESSILYMAGLGKPEKTE